MLEIKIHSMLVDSFTSFQLGQLLDFSQISTLQNLKTRSNFKSS